MEAVIRCRGENPFAHAAKHAFGVLQTVRTNPQSVRNSQVRGEPSSHFPHVHYTVFGRLFGYGSDQLVTALQEPSEEAFHPPTRECWGELRPQVSPS